eukprot:TRINITY_DN212_c0_g1_i1.p1 TRINITY_DN212_c0_g1~~TRINITY_DN212_c0_g1_i1.p1  ORF type:complete len:391 (-),score=76.22 TRINITY_DN212_c0_g1_i1:269-1441(-)
MAASSLCKKVTFDLCTPTQIRQIESGSRSAVCFASCTSNIVPQTQRSKKNVGPNARKVTANAERLSASATYGGVARRWRAADSLPRRPRQESTRRTRVTASKDGSEVVLEWKGEATEVSLTGSFLDWDKKVPLEKAGDGVFKVKYTLPPGAHQYKFLVDGEWQHRSDVDTVPDGNGGVNNQVVVEEEKGETESAAKTQESAGAASEPKPKAKPAAAKPAAKAAAKPAAKAAAKAAAPAAKEADNGAPTADAAPTPKAKPAAKGKVAAKAGKKAGKAPAKALNELMQEDVVPMLAAELEKENVTDVELVWESNELRGCFVNGGVPYCFWAFFPDGKIEGSRGFSLTSHGYPPSTIEPFFDGERPQGMTADMMVFWIKKRLFAQKSALPKLN